jgi:hypothetical protein
MAQEALHSLFRAGQFCVWYEARQLAKLVSRVLLREHEEVGQIDAVNGGQVHEHINARHLLAPLDRVDVAPIHIEPRRDIVYAQPVLLSQLVQSITEQPAERSHSQPRR